MITKQKGTYDIYGKEAKEREYINSIIRDICEKYNYGYIETPVFEASELFHRSVGETSDMVSKETYDFKDRGDRDLTLRPEGTAGVSRFFIENKLYGNQTEPLKVYYNAKMYRYERPQSGRNREFTQFGVECIGSDSVIADADVISIAYQTYKLLGLDNVVVKINSLGDTESRNRYHDALKAYLIPHINELCDDCQNRLNKNPLRILDCKIDADNEIIKNAPKPMDYLNEESLVRYNKLKDALDMLEVNYEEDNSLVRGLDYYTHTVFELFADVGSLGQMALCGGGRYDGLIEILGGPRTPAVGFAVGYDRTVMAIKESGINIPVRETADVYVLAVSDAERDTALYIVQNLRLNGIVAEYDLMNRNLKGQFKASERFGAKVLIILNEEDLNNNEVNVKDTLTKEETKVKINDLADYLDMNL